MRQSVSEYASKNRCVCVLFMVPSELRHVVWHLNLEMKEKPDGEKTVFSSLISDKTLSKLRAGTILTCSNISASFSRSLVMMGEWLGCILNKNKNALIYTEPCILFCECSQVQANVGFINNRAKSWKIYGQCPSLGQHLPKGLHLQVIMPLYS